MFSKVFLVKNKKNAYLLAFIIAAILTVGFFHFTQAANTTYTPMEKIPGTSFSSATTFKQYVEAIYKFGIWTIGIAAMMMIMIGGFMYMTSAGNNASMGKAKGIITDAIIGLIMAMTAYLLLYTINPDLVKVNINLSSSTSSSSSSSDKTSSTASQQQAACNKWCTDNKADTSNEETKADAESYNANCLNGCSENYASMIGGSTAAYTGSLGTGKNCEKLDAALANGNTSGVDARVLKTLAAGGEGGRTSEGRCNGNLSSDGHGSCGYFQVTEKNRCAVCGLCGSDSCSKVQNDTETDVNCAAKFVKQEMYGTRKCGTTDLSCIGSYYNDSGNCSKTTDDYCGRISTYWNSNFSK